MSKDLKSRVMVYLQNLLVCHGVTNAIVFVFLVLLGIRDCKCYPIGQFSRSSRKTFVITRIRYAKQDKKTKRWPYTGTGSERNTDPVF